MPTPLPNASHHMKGWISGMNGCTLIECGMNSCAYSWNAVVVFRKALIAEWGTEFSNVLETTFFWYYILIVFWNG